MSGIGNQHSANGSIGPGGPRDGLCKLLVGELLKQFQALLARGRQVGKDLFQAVISVFFGVSLVLSMNPGKHFVPLRCAYPGVEAKWVWISLDGSTDHPLKLSLDKREMRKMIFRSPGQATRELILCTRAFQLFGGQCPEVSEELLV
ncbi:hypothetical protein KSD_72160 [Ktedonobacter sp. SOSP1-85]|nr:hypothetical protein [Ktedonobacter sp. SOSP1-85]GHO79445.1 hypothetical protein KSD_72160 [Ktedonobacter sp. SOSP1-85]